MSHGSTGEPRLILSMIVKNEEKVIGRCLDSVLPLCDAFVIVDTGSTDKTKEEIRQASLRHDVHGIVVDNVWKNFGYNRTHAAAVTRQYAKERSASFPLSNTYMLLLDADMVLGSRGFSRTELQLPAYLVEQRCEPVAWDNTRLCRLDHEWRAVGVTHEFWAPTPDYLPNVKLSSLWINDLGDGGSKTGKLERDFGLLWNGLIEEPNNGRYYFYLGETLWYLGRYEQAIVPYRKRIELGGWEEECWYSLFRIGECLLKLGKEAEAFWAFIEAYDRRPARAEPLARMSRYLREKRTSATALLLADKALVTPIPKDTLFVDTSAYRQGPLVDVSILSFYHGSKERGLSAAEEILSTRGLSVERYEEAARNALFYRAPALPARRRGKFEVPAELRTFNGTEYLSSSAALVRTPSGVLANIRLVNYDHSNGRSFVARDPDHRIRTENILYDFDPETCQISNPWIQLPKLPDDWDPTTKVLGLEDERWAYHNGKLYFTTVVYQIPGHLNHPQMALGIAERYGPAVVRPLKYAGAGQIEKSWLPFSHGGELLLIYGYEPFTVLRLDTETAECTPTQVRRLNVRAAKWRGNTPPVGMPDGRMLMLVHELAYRWHDNVYLHRFLELDPTTILPTRYSEAFSFDHQGVEYALGLIAHGDNVIATFGYEERESHWIEIDPKVIPWLPFTP